MNRVADLDCQIVQGCAGETSLPETEPHNHGRRAPDATFVVAKTAADDRMNAHDVEELARHGCSRRHRGLRPHRDWNRAGGHLRHGLKAVRAVLPILEVGFGYVAVPTSVGVDLQEPHNPIRLGIRERTQQDPVHDTEHRRGSADTKAQRDDGDGSKRFRAAEDSQAVTEVANEVLEKGRAKFVSRLFLHVLDASKLHVRVSAGFSGIHPGAEVLLGLLIDMEPNLLVQSVFDVTAADDRPPTAQKFA